MRLLALSLLVAACSSPAPVAPGEGGAGIPTPSMAVGDPAPVVPHPDGVAGGQQFAGSDAPTMDLDGCTVYTVPGETEAQATVVHHDDGESLTVDFMPYTRVLGAAACPAPGVDSYRIGGEGGERSGRFMGLTARRYSTLFTVDVAQMGGQLNVFDAGDGARITSLSFWDGDLSPTVVAPNTLVFDRYLGSPEEAGVACSTDPDGEPPFVVERTRLDLDARTTDSDGLRCIG